MKWKQDLEALIESTMALAKDVKRQPAGFDPPANPPNVSSLVASRAVAQALGDIPTAGNPPAAQPLIGLPRSERDEIRQRVSSFKAYQEKLARQREEYYLQVKAKMMASVDPNWTSLNSRKSPPQ